MIALFNGSTKGTKLSSISEIRLLNLNLHIFSPTPCRSCSRANITHSSRLKKIQTELKKLNSNTICKYISYNVPIHLHNSAIYRHIANSDILFLPLPPTNTTTHNERNNDCYSDFFAVPVSFGNWERFSTGWPPLHSSGNPCRHCLYLAQ